MRLIRVVCSLTVFILLTFSLAEGSTIRQFGTGDLSWPVTWTQISSLNDPDDGVQDQLDFVGDPNDPCAYWAYDDDYLFFRMRVDVGTVESDTFVDSLFVLIDKPGEGVDGEPDYGLAWDTKGLTNVGEEDEHGLEFTVLDTSGGKWDSTRMDDIDGNAAKKIVPPDINRTGDGYIQTTDGVSTENFGDTTLVDWAVSWSYLALHSTIGPGQTWLIQYGSIANATDHNYITTDVAGGTNPSDPGMDWSEPLTSNDIPEPGTWAMLACGLAALALLAARRRQSHS